jgi:hypothetical protein
MGTPSELVQAVAEALGIPVATVVQYDRNLAAAGLRTVRGRGPSAANVSSHDAANLLISICGAPISGASVKESYRTCRRYGSLRSRGRSKSFSRLKRSFPILARLPEEHLFADAVAALIDSMAVGEFGRTQDLYSWSLVSVTFQAPHPQATIVVEKPHRIQLTYGETEDFNFDDSDFRQRRTFGYGTLLKVARVVGAAGRQANRASQ